MMSDNPYTFTVKITIRDIFIVTSVFIFQKALGAIDWSWWWVISPFWIYYAFILILAVILGTRDAFDNTNNSDWRV
jgi:hypothetical protein